MQNQLRKLNAEALVEIFVSRIISGDAASTAREANKHSKVQLAAFVELVRRYGDEGREVLGVLLDHENLSVRVNAAAFLLRYKHDDAMRVLRELEKGRGIPSLAARYSIKNWNDGTWELDPEP